MELNSKKLTHLEAWAHFHTVYKALDTTSKRAIPAAFRERIRNAQRDYKGERVDKRSGVLSLGEDRVRDILLEASGLLPGTFHYTYHKEAWFEVGK